MGRACGKSHLLNRGRNGRLRTGESGDYYMINVLNPPFEIRLGYVGENEFRPIQFDVSAWLQAYPQGTVSIVFSRPDGLLYPVVENCTESPAEWKPSVADLSIQGSGYVEARIISGDVIGKSSKIQTRTVSSLGSSGNPPDPPVPDWTVEVAQNASNASRSATSAASSATAAAGSATDAQTAQEAAETSVASAAGSAAASESWAVGGTRTRAGEDTNNAHYWSIVAQDAAAGGVSTFKGRSGAVVPASGDYTPSMVGADASGAAAAALASAKSYADGLAPNYDQAGAAATVQGNLDVHTQDTDAHASTEEKAAWNGKQAALTAGTNITIVDNVISATGGL